MYIEYKLSVWKLKVYFLIFPSKANGVISSDKVEQVMKSIDRGDFCKSNPYYDSPQGIGYGVTISAPHMVRSF